MIRADEEVDLRAELRELELERVARARMSGARSAWLTACRLVVHVSTAWLCAWGFWAAILVRPHTSEAWDVLERLGGVDVYGITLAVIGALSLIAQVTGGRWVRRVAKAAVPAAWGWVWVTLAAGSWSSTATLMYAVGAMLTLLAGWLCWGRENEPSGPWPWEV